MTFENGNMPTYRQFVFGVAFQSALAMSLIPLAWVAMTAFFGGWVYLLAGVYPLGEFVPSLAELTAVGTHWLSVAAFGTTWFCILIYQNDRWVEMHRKPPTAERPPRPFAAQSLNETRRIKNVTHVGRRKWFPNFAHHYAALYHNLERNEWKITRRNIDIEADGVKIFTNMTDNYLDIVKEWARLGFVDGWLSGEAREKWALNESGRAHFAEYGRVHNGSHSPTEND